MDFDGFSTKIRRQLRTTRHFSLTKKTDTTLQAKKHCSANNEVILRLACFLNHARQHPSCN